jgi:hypothetical protein
VLLGDHADECVELVDVPVDRLQPGGKGRASDADDRALLGPEVEPLAVRVEDLDEVEDVRVREIRT